MSDFKVNLSGLDKEISNLTNYSNNIKNIHTQFEQIRESLRKDHSEFLIIASHILRTIDEEILNEAAKMGKLSEALGYIVQKYSNCENAIVNSDLTKNTSSSREPNTEQNNSSEKNIFERFIEWLRNRFILDVALPMERHLRNLVGLDVSLEMEQKHDLALQSEIFSSLKTNRFSEDTWYNASIEERKEILKDFLIYLNGIMGLNVSWAINFRKDMEEGNAGGFNRFLNKISINEKYLSGDNSYVLMQTMIHEMRHAYQRAAINNPEKYMVSPETIAQWKNNFSNYYKGGSYEKYVSQPIEWDAKNFAKQYIDLKNANPEYRGGW